MAAAVCMQHILYAAGGKIRREDEGNEICLNTERCKGDVREAESLLPDRKRLNTPDEGSE